MWPVLGALVVGGIAATIAYLAASNDIDKAVTNGPARFVGMAGGIGLCVGWYVTLLLTRGARAARHGITLSYQRIEPTATGYREITTLTVDDLLAKLREVGVRADGQGVRRARYRPRTDRELHAARRREPRDHRSEGEGLDPRPARTTAGR